MLSHILEPVKIVDVLDSHKHEKEPTTGRAGWRSEVSWTGLVVIEDRKSPY